MELLISFIFILIPIILLLPITVLFLECLSAVIASFQASSDLPKSDPSIAILIPAHNEEKQIKRTLLPLIEAINQPKNIIVIADNCEDETAKLAGQMQVTVLERTNLNECGKGYALDYGINYLANSPPSVVVILDADCYLAKDSLVHITRQSFTQQRPVQSVNLLEKSLYATPKDSVSEFAFLVKNWVRPLGLSYWNLPCLLTGTGMAFPWSILEQLPLASGNIVEDMQLGIDSAIAQFPPLLAKDAKVTSPASNNIKATTSQRTRWEHGHLQTISQQVPRLLKEAIKQKRIDLLALALEVAVPPLSLLVMLWLIVTIFSLIIGFFGNYWWSLGLQAISGSLLLLAIFMSWYRFGREYLHFKTLLTIPFYLMWKIPIYLRFLVRPQKEWIRTERDQ